MVAIVKTRAELVTRAAEKIPGVLPSGQSLEAEDAAKIDGVIDATLADLAAPGRDVIDIDASQIPIEAFEWVADCVAQMVCLDVAGVPRDPNVTLFAEMRLRQISASRPSYETLKAEYF